MHLRAAVNPQVVVPEGGAGLDLVLRENSYKITPVLHGADYPRWNPATDPLLPSRYDSETILGKQINRDALLSGLGLDPAPAYRSFTGRE